MKSLAIVPLLVVSFIATCTANINRVDYIALEDPSSPCSSEESSESKSFLQGIETACYEKTGSTRLYEDVLISMSTVPFCLLTQMDVFGFVEDLEHLNASTRYEFFPKYCPQISRVIPCLEVPTKKLSQCLDHDDALILLGTYNATPEALDLVCKNDGELLFQNDTNYDVCMKNYSNYTDECVGFVSNTTNFMEVSKYGEAQCEELTKVRDCMQGKFDECNGPRIMDVFDVFYRAVLDNSPCRNRIIGLNVAEDDKEPNTTV